DHEQADCASRLAFLVAAGGPGVGDASAVRRLGEIEGAAAFAPGEAELLGELRDRRAAAPARAAPAEDDPLRPGYGRGARVRGPPEAAALPRRAPAPMRPARGRAAAPVAAAARAGPRHAGACTRSGPCRRSSPRRSPGGCGRGSA